MKFHQTLTHKIMIISYPTRSFCVYFDFILFTDWQFIIAGGSLFYTHQFLLLKHGWVFATDKGPWLLVACMYFSFKFQSINEIYILTDTIYHVPRWSAGVHQNGGWSAIGGVVLLLWHLAANLRTSFLQGIATDLGCSRGGPYDVTVEYVIPWPISALTVLFGDIPQIRGITHT